MRTKLFYIPPIAGDRNVFVIVVARDCDSCMTIAQMVLQSRTPIVVREARASQKLSCAKVNVVGRELRQIIAHDHSIGKNGAHVIEQRLFDQSRAAEAIDPISADIFAM